MENKSADPRYDDHGTLEAVGGSLTPEGREEYEQAALAHLRANPGAPDADLVALMERIRAS